MSYILRLKDDPINQRGIAAPKPYLYLSEQYPKEGCGGWWSDNPANANLFETTEAVLIAAAEEAVRSPMRPQDELHILTSKGQVVRSIKECELREQIAQGVPAITSPANSDRIEL